MASFGVCGEIRRLSAAQRPRRLLLMGHSLGGLAALNIARCLDPIPVDLLVMVDRVTDSPEMPEERRLVVPDNVRSSRNYFQRVDLLAGEPDSRRADGGRRGIENVRLKVPFFPSAHYAVLYRVVDEGVVARLLDEHLD